MSRLIRVRVGRLPPVDPPVAPGDILHGTDAARSNTGLVGAGVERSSLTLVTPENASSLGLAYFYEENSSQGRHRYQTTSDGQTLENLHFVGWVRVPHSDVTFRHCLFQAWDEVDSFDSMILLWFTTSSFRPTIEWCDLEMYPDYKRRCRAVGFPQGSDSEDEWWGTWYGTEQRGQRALVRRNYLDNTTSFITMNRNVDVVENVIAKYGPLVWHAHSSGMGTWAGSGGANPDDADQPGTNQYVARNYVEQKWDGTYEGTRNTGNSDDGGISSASVNYTTGGPLQNQLYEANVFVSEGWYVLTGWEHGHSPGGYTAAQMNALNKKTVFDDNVVFNMRDGFENPRTQIFSGYECSREGNAVINNHFGTLEGDHWVKDETWPFNYC